MNVAPNASILVTGSAGAIGRAVVAGLKAGGRRVRGFDRLPTPEADESVVGDLTDAAALTQAAQGVGGIVHLAAVPDDEDFMSRLLPNNLIGLYNLWEAARLAEVKRVVIASTGQVVWWQLLDGPFPIKTDVLYTPRDWYAVTKVAAEAAGMSYARKYSMAVIAVRLGWFPRTPEHAAELASTDRGPNVYFSPGDAASFFRRCIEAPLEPGFTPLYAASRSLTKSIFDLEPCKRLLGWEPQDQWPTGAEQLVAAAHRAGL